MATSPTTQSRIDGNPAKYDPALKGLIDKLEDVHSVRAFRQWKGTFLREFEKFLVDGGVEPAHMAYVQFASKMETFERTVAQVKKLLINGDISTERTTVRGRYSLNEMYNSIGSIIREQKELVPTTAADEKKKNYNKYHLGAILVHYGFKEYDSMVRCEQMMKEMREQHGLEEIASKQQLAEIDKYSKQILQFQEIMSDLGLFDVMRKSLVFVDGEMDEVIFFEPKTKSIIAMPRDYVIKMGILTVTENADGTSQIREEEKSDIQKQEMIEKIKTFYE